MVKVGLIALAGLTLLWLLADRRSGQRLARWSSSLERAPQQTHRGLAFVLIVAWTVILCFVKVQQQALIQTGFDLAIYANVAWHMVHGPIFYDAIFDRNILGGHFSPIYLLLGLFYEVYPHPATLMVVQSLGLGLGAVAVYLIAVRRLGYSLWPFGALALYCAHSYLHIAHAKDFHTTLLAIPVLLWMVYGVECGRRVVVVLLGALALTIEEGVPPAVAGVGLYLIAFRAPLRIVGWVCLLMATAYFFVVTAVMMPLLSKPGSHLLWDRYAHLGGSVKEALINLVTHPLWAVQQAVIVDNKWFYLLAFFGSLGFVPLLAWRESLLTTLPLLAMILSRNPGQYKLGFHYAAPALPYLYYAMVHGVRVARKHLSVWIPSMEIRSRVAVGVVAALVGFNVSQFPSYDLTRIDHDYVIAARQVLSVIPDGASVAASGALVPQLVNRHLVCYVQWEPGRLCEWGAPTFVMLDLGERRSQAVPLSMRRQYVTSLVNGLGYVIVRDQGDFVILQGRERLGHEFAPSPLMKTF